MAYTYQILVVDDDFSIVNIIETALKQAGYQVLTAHDGEAPCHHGCDDAPMQWNHCHYAHPSEQ